MRVCAPFLVVISLVCRAEFSHAQAPTDQPTTEAPPKVDPPAVQEGESLDKLLGIAEGDGKRASEESARSQQESLKRVLSEKVPQNTLEVTVAAMRRSAELLGEKETGTAVQRIQEEILARLDALIQSAQSQQEQQSSSSSSSSSGEESKGSQKSKGSKGKPQAGSEEQQRREQAKKRAEQAAGKQETGRSQESGEGPPDQPPGTETIESGVIAETDEEWGSLPPRTREVLRQGVREKMSSMYRRWTEAYYRRIAEESKE